MKILLVYPQCPDTFWSFKHALKFVSKKASFPPLGALTVAAMLPREWDKKLVDMNVSILKDEDIQWADYVFISAMVVQKESVKSVILRCKSLGKKIVAGGPLFTTEPHNFEGVDHFILNEAEITLPLFLADMKNGHPQKIYSTAVHPQITQTPAPMWSLIKMNKYSSMNIQYSRGCPFNCEFCDITFLDGNIPRTKNKEQILTEMDSLYQAGWRGDVFFVDDNFIGNKKKLKEETLPAIIDWMQRHKRPFNLFTEVSVNLADDEELMHLMEQAGFNKVFVGIETPNEASLSECDKKQNTRRDLIATVKILQNHGFEVMGGFIVGFDSDTPAIFKTQINFIQKSGIVTAMVGLLNAPRGTRLFQRLKRENRLLKESTGDNTDFSLNFVPRMKPETLISGYKEILNTIYSPKHYYERIGNLLREYKPRTKSFSLHSKRWNIQGFFNCMWFMGIRESGRRYYWRLLVSTLFTKPRSFPLFISLSIYGYHFRRVIRKYVNTPDAAVV
ncbi:MAG: B12-binding domain-containing radical SAM protein [Dehalococcoidales bacterium]|nr:B12-binding domain-containing radical SAM protein [Dehalococcoidales bacterium]